MQFRANLLVPTLLLALPHKGNAASGPQCPTIETVGVFNLTFNPAFLAVEEELGDETSLFISSFFNVAVSQVPGPPFIPFFRDVVAKITGLQDLEADPTTFVNNAAVEELTDLGSSTPPKTVWPNGSILAPTGVFPFRAIVIPQGFHVAGAPGRLTAINLDDPLRTEYIIHQSTQLSTGFNPANIYDPQNMPRFYHDAAFYDVDKDGLLDIVTVRSGFRVGRNVYPPLGELVWFKNPGQSLLPQVEWKATVLYGAPFSPSSLGPDLFLRLQDFDGDGVPEIVATHFFSAGSSPNEGKFVLYAAPAGNDWSVVDAFNSTAPKPRVKNLVTDQGKPFDIEIVDLNGDGKLDILASNHQPSDQSTIPGRVFAIEQPASGNIFDSDWTTHVLLDGVRPAPFAPGASPLTPGKATAVYPFPGNNKQQGLKPWILVSGDEGAKVWLLEPNAKVDWTYDSRVIFDIDEYYGPGTTSTPLQNPAGITISTIGKPAVMASQAKEGDLLLFVPVFEATDIHVLRLTSACGANHTNFLRHKK